MTAHDIHANSVRASVRKAYDCLSSVQTALTPFVRTQHKHQAALWVAYGCTAMSKSGHSFICTLQCIPLPCGTIIGFSSFSYYLLTTSMPVVLTTCMRIAYDRSRHPCK